MTAHTLPNEYYRPSYILRSTALDTIFGVAASVAGFVAGAKWQNVNADIVAALAATHEITPDFPGQMIWCAALGTGFVLGLLRAPMKVAVPFIALMAVGMAVVGHESAQLAQEFAPVVAP